VIVRGSLSGGNDYLCEVLGSGSGHQITKLFNGVPTSLASDANAANTGDVIHCQVAGNVLTYFVNGIQILTAKDSTFGAGFPGIKFFSTGGGFDNFAAGNVNQTFPRLISEQNWSAPQHFERSVTIGNPAPISGPLAANTLYTPSLNLNGVNISSAVAKLRCERGLGDGRNALPAGTYLQSNCYNDSGITWKITGIKCFTDNNGTSKLNASGNTLGALLLGSGNTERERLTDQRRLHKIHVRR
jgi:hypothetical protein